MYIHLLHLTDTAAGLAEIHRLGGRVQLRLSDRLMVVELPRNVDMALLHRARPLSAASRSALSPQEIELARAWLQSHAGSSRTAIRNLGPTTPEDGLSWTTNGFMPPTVEQPDAFAAQGVDPSAYYLQGSVSCGVVIVSGPSSLAFSSSEVGQIQSEVLDGLSYLAGAEPTANVSFVPSFTVATITAQNTCDGKSCGACEQVWLPPALTALGYSSVTAYKSALKANNGTDWAYAAFFIKYNACWFAYAYFNGYLCMQYSNDGWGPSNIHKVFAHESGHIFDAADEYSTTTRQCSCSQTYGYLQVSNGNCVECPAHTQLPCLMNANTFAMCSWTRGQLGWQRWGAPVNVSAINLAQTSSGLGAAPLGTNEVLFAFLGTDEETLWCFTYDGSTFSGETKISDQNGALSSDTPALAQFNGAVYMAYQGHGTTELWGCSTADGSHWSGQTNITSQNGAQSSAGPALAAYDGDLYMAYKGASTDNLYVCAFDGTTWGNQINITTINSAQTSTSPALAVFGGKLYLIFVGGSGSRLWYCTFDGKSWSGQVEITAINGAETSTPVAAFAFDGFLQLLYKDQSSGNMWTCAFDGSRWLDPVSVTEENGATTSMCPGVGVIGTSQAAACFRGYGTTNVLSMSLFAAAPNPG